MMDWLQGEEPDEGILALASPPLKHMWMNRADPEDRGLQMVVPQHLQEEVLRLGHDVPTAGHQGINCTKERLQPYWWYRCGSHIRVYVNTCGICNSMKKSVRHLGIPCHYTIQDVRWKGCI
ncbi:hypothetical protein PoB_002893200 [Plakobranchus ocellatus]|uniref:Integrase zinc-binding domain-containing protein n=1 Tax=Plakobranchus ocellatus TaxID=259542 RepID=A0AAV4A6G0_9GAST|nr:hypothetical protein PoB_002893200 [Plakobranchus ocellatus]